MNTLAIGLVCLALGQTSATEFQPPRGISTGQPASSSVEEPAVETGSRFTVTDESTQPTSPPGITLQPNETWDSRQVAPAAASGAEPGSSAAPVYSEDPLELATTILKHVGSASISEGKRVPLVDVLRRFSDPPSRQRAIGAYWRLAIAVFGHDFAAQETQYLTRIPRPNTRLEQSLLRAQQARAAARQSQTGLDVLKQQESGVAVFAVTGEELPLPADLPFIGPYRTKLTTIYSRSTPPRRLEQIDRSLPRQLDVVERRAESIAAGEAALSELTDAYAQGLVGISLVLSSFKDLSHERREFLAAVLDYNEQIAEYALAVVGPNVAPQTLLGTLIRIEAASSPTLLAGANVRPASAEEPVDDPPNRGGFRELQAKSDPRSRESATEQAIVPGTRSILRRLIIDHDSE